jgi:glutamate-5-semialdehyde dehydrogenase
MTYIEEICQNARRASRPLAQTTTTRRNHLLMALADQIWLDREVILAQNQMDIALAKNAGLSEALIDRLSLNESRLAGVLADIRNVATLPDPVGEIIEETDMPNGLHVHKQRVPLGVLAVIYESRPNVTLDIASLALKSGNAAILRGGSETIHTNQALVNSILKSLEANDLPANTIQFISNPDHSLVAELLKQYDFVDMVIPRGGPTLHQYCRENSLIPVITGGIGICHLFVDESANLQAALPVIRNAKIQRPSVCNALDTALIHRKIAREFIPQLVTRLQQDGVTFRADPEAYQILGSDPLEGILRAGESDFDTEWLALILGIKVVGNIKEAIAHITAHSTGHSDGILTEDEENAKEFIAKVDSAVVYVNASTRFTDGSQLGLGAEVAISTQRLHARGPMGLRELTTYKWVVRGDYTVRN